MGCPKSSQTAHCFHVFHRSELRGSILGRFRTHHGCLNFGRGLRVRTASADVGLGFGFAGMDAHYRLLEGSIDFALRTPRSRLQVRRES